MLKIVATFLYVSGLLFLSGCGGGSRGLGVDSENPAPGPVAPPIPAATPTPSVTASPVASDNSIPLADAGLDQDVSVSTTVFLDASSSSDVDLDTLNYLWSFTSVPDGSSAVLSNSTDVNPTFVADIDGSYVLQLVVNDGSLDSVADTVVITATTANSVPVASAGSDQNVVTTASVILDGSDSSDADLDTLNYLWSFTSVPDGSSAVLSNSEDVNPTFVADIDGSYVLELVVSDGSVNSAADTAIVTAFIPTPEVINVAPFAETDPVPSSGDAADDPAIWVHPTVPSLSVIIGTDKLSGIALYNLDGTQHQYLPDGNFNNVDIRYGFSLVGESIDVIGASNRTDDTLVFYKIDPVTRQLSSVGSVSSSLAVYGFCMYKSAIGGQFYAFVNDKNGQVEQYELLDNNGIIDGILVRSISVGSITEGCVADDEYANFYIGEETESIWRYGAEATDGSTRHEVDSAGNNFTADVEGLSIYYASGGQGYLIASSQGSDEFVLYDRATNIYVGSFRVVSGNGIDSVTGTDGIDVISTPLGPNFPFGIFVAQDNINTGANQNFKVVKWEDIAESFTDDLRMENSWNPRNGR